MTPDELIDRRKQAWTRLAAILERAERARLPSLSETELLELGQLYRSATSDLALAQRDFPRHALTQYLNQLVGRAHPVIYRGEPLVLRRVGQFYTRTFPQLYRELAPFILAAVVLFFGTAIVSYGVVQLNPKAANYVLPPFLIDDIEAGRAWWKDLNDANNIGLALIMTNNLQVAFQAFASGIAFGLFTAYILIMNGLNLGMTLSLMQVYGHAGPLWEFVIGHGVLELSEITMAGGSGLLIGYALLHPGLLSRRDALQAAAQKSIQLLLGSAPLLVIAGAIEALVSPSNVAAPIKYAIGITTGILLYAYLLLAGRSYAGLAKRLRRYPLLHRLFR